MPEATRLETKKIGDIVVEIFRTLSGLELSPSPGERLPAVWAVTASLGMTGETRYNLALQMGEGPALQVSSRMLQDRFEAWDPAVADAIGEVANIIAGNIKPHVEAGMKLSMPTVVRGDNYAFSTPRMVVVQTAHFLCEGEPLQVTLSREA